MLLDCKHLGLGEHIDSCMADIIPTDRGSKKDTFTALSASFALDEKVLALLLNSPINNLEDLRFYFTQ